MSPCEALGMTTYEEIPRPKGVPVLGNAFEIHMASLWADLVRLGHELGPVYAIDAPGYHDSVVITGREVAAEVTDDERFDKVPFDRVRAVLGDGLLTAATDDPVWARCHRIARPTFTPGAVQESFDHLLDAVEQLVERIARSPEGAALDVDELVTSYTLETIGLVAFSHRFGAMYGETRALVEDLSTALELLGKGTGKDDLYGRLHPGDARTFRDAVARVNAFTDDLITARRKLGDDAPDDLMTRLLTDVDPDDGSHLTDLQIRNQVLTLLVAGHETTAGAIAFSLYYLSAHADVQAWAREQVDDVLGSDRNRLPTFGEIAQCDRIEKVLYETLRLQPVAPALARHAREPTTLCGRYRVEPKHVLAVVLNGIQRDVESWGTDAEEWRPRRWELQPDPPEGSFMPFGVGQRSCIGRALALAEAQLALAVLLHRYEISDPGHQPLRTEMRLTLRPKDLHLRFDPRPDVRPVDTGTASEAPATQQALEPEPTTPPAEPVVTSKSLNLALAHGSDSGTARRLCRELAQQAFTAGDRTTITALDDVAGELPLDQPFIVVAASYNGQPAEEATAFVRWLETAPDGAADGLCYAVFGCGDHHWSSTYQRVPHLIDEGLQRLGGTRIVELGDGDTSGDFHGAFAQWSSRLWSALDADAHRPPPDRSNIIEEYTSKVVGHTPIDGPGPGYGLHPATVVGARQLYRYEGNDSFTRSVAHVDVGLESGAPYQPGDHLLVMPFNLPPILQRTAVALGIDLTAIVELRANTPVEGHLPLDVPISMRALMEQYLDLRAPATRQGIENLAALIDEERRRAPLEALLASDDDYAEHVLSRRASLVDLATEYPPDHEMTPTSLMVSFPPLKPRPYSISSSPLATPRQASIAVGLVSGPARSGHGLYYGVTSAQLVSAGFGSRLLVRVRSVDDAFHPPEDGATPMILVCTGTGVAPFRSFLEDRALRRVAGEPAGPVILFRGCRRPDRDRLYGEDLDTWAAQGWLRLEEAYSDEPGSPKQYVQDRIRAERDDVLTMVDGGAHVYVCGNAKTVQPAVRATFATIYREETGASHGEAEDWMRRLQDEQRYIRDTWGS